MPPRLRIKTRTRQKWTSTWRQPQLKSIENDPKQTHECGRGNHCSKITTISSTARMLAITADAMRYPVEKPGSSREPVGKGSMHKSSPVGPRNLSTNQLDSYRKSLGRFGKVCADRQSTAFPLGTSGCGEFIRFTSRAISDLDCAQRSLRCPIKPSVVLIGCCRSGWGTKCDGANS